MIRISRVELLRTLQTVAAGLSTRGESVEQSACFVFKDGQVMTYNDEVACRMQTPLNKKFIGAVQAKPLVDILGKMREEEVEIQYSEGEFLVVGQKRRCGIRMESEITLPIDSAELPGDEWQPMHEDFSDAISIVQECASRDESRFALTCLHVAPKWIEATDNFHMTRYRIETGVKESCLIRRDSLRHIINLEMCEFNETETWIHFRNAAGLVLSCRRYLESYKDLKPFLKIKGEPIELPDGLVEAAEKAEVFSSENADSNQVFVDLKAGRLRIKGVGNSGWYSEVKQLRYDGPDLSFMISPKLLKEISKRHSGCEITHNCLKMNGGKWIYVTCLGQVEKNPDKE